MSGDGADPTQPAVVTRAARKQAIFDHVFKTLCEFEDDDPLLDALARANIKDVSVAVNLTEQKKQALQWDDSGTLKPVPLGNLEHLVLLQQFHRYVCYEENELVEWTNLTVDEYDEFRIAGYDSENPIAPYRNGQGQATPTGSTVVTPTSSPSRPTLTPAQAFDKGVKRDPSLFKEFRYEKDWSDEIVWFPLSLFLRLQHPTL